MMTTIRTIDDTMPAAGLQSSMAFKATPTMIRHGSAASKVLAKETPLAMIKSDGLHAS